MTIAIAAAQRMLELTVNMQKVRRPMWSKFSSARVVRFIVTPTHTQITTTAALKKASWHCRLVIFIALSITRKLLSKRPQRRAGGGVLLRPYSTTARRCRARARDTLRSPQYPTTTPSTMKPSTSRKLTRNSGALLRIQVKYSTSIIDSEISSTGEVGKITFV